MMRQLANPLLAALLLAVAGPAAEAAWLGFRNETPVPIVVQGASVVGNAVRRGRPHLLYPGEVAWDSVSIPGEKVLTIHLAKQPALILLRETVPFKGSDLFFAIQLDTQQPTDRTKPAPVKVKLTPAKPPVTPPGSQAPPPPSP